MRGGRKNILRWSLQYIYSFCLGGGRKYIVGSKRLCELGTNGRKDGLTDGQTKPDVEVGAPPKKISFNIKNRSNQY